MEGNLSEGDGQMAAVKDKEDMEITVTTQLENLLVTPDNAETASNTQTLSEEKSVDAQTHSIAATVSVDGVCKSTDCSDEDSEDSDSDSSSSSSSSSSSLSSPSAPVLEEDDDDEGFSQPAPIKTQDEVLLEELPAVEEVCVTLPEEAELQPLGSVSNLIQQLVIIQSLKDTPPLNEGSIIFKSDREAAGKVFEVFGPVSSPLYILRFNSVDQISSKGLKEGTTLYYAPAIKEYTGYILTQQLRLLKGSDASWKNDQEPPEEALDYSDDEKEQEAKRKLKNAKKKRDTSNTDNSSQKAHQQKYDVRGFPPRHERPSFQHQHSRQFRHTQPPPGHTNIPPVFLPPPCPYPPPPPQFPPSNFHFYPPPPPSFFNPSFSSPFWPPNTPAFSDFPSPPPPPPPPPPPQ
ncbi:H/ACA ribonucleoprotein complex non-core subunit NAF1-like [Archocentrus centrarchus]|uniref:H/ACA ribonucleoprotein complex non-core subunit NAF1-like n=1 Tax=Archocentrus centrarchus TaxID=63155 RepID=UPI0011E9F178|nr:H/ACA ribonucleoprotein complex non-core subunit NAF1-like [Archocentrus centrarchus]XP_030580479.1 H/ACA ribonucleoprotein complex non-core subunit NAF1-like [Archocentrus centrarchus]XP_030580480.1 H/ACA ribonucleoprotein complex non-core subunit NAF1-like [Archocentrus centrarchus]XP_030580481.1 H/ACA ribonucleoprotein complex non-core subunit NAF1-like [Archocentrus centrarchus]